MKTILEFIRQELQETSYYLGTVFWAAGSLLSELGKMKKSAIDSGLASQDLNWMVSLYNKGAVVAIIIGTLFSVHLTLKLRRPFATYQPTYWWFVLSWLWASIKIGLLVGLLFLPATIYGVANSMRGITDIIRFGTILIALVLVVLPFGVVLFYGSFSMLIARGRAHRIIRDGVRAFPRIWREALLGILLGLVPLIIITPIRLLSFKFHILEIIAIGLSVCFSPYSFGVMTAVYLFLGETLIEKAPQLVHPAGAPATSASAQ